MTYFLRLVAIIGIYGITMGQPAMALTGQAKNRRLLVRYNQDASINTMSWTNFAAGVHVLKSFEVPSKLELVEVAKGISLEAAQEYYRENPNVLYVEPDYELNADFSSSPEDSILDPKYIEQWGLNNSGQTDGIEDVDINAPQMWDVVDGDKNIVVAVIDTGLNYNHPDLKNRIWVNTGEIPGNDIDDDQNGVVDDVHGFNAINKSGDPMDDHGHGSHCAGVIAAEANNTYGGKGVMPNVAILSCKFLNAKNRGSTSDAIDCLNYLRDLKIRSKDPVDIFATSNSWSGGDASNSMRDAIKEHQDLGILFIASASNNSDNNDLVRVYPANYPLANIISVAAIDDKGKKAQFSNYGKHSVHVAAPGVGILSTVLGDEYKKMNGTSMAAPFVTGLAAMIHDSKPELDYLAIKNLLIAGGVPSVELADKTISGRRIRAIDTNGLGSLSCQNQIVSGRLSPSNNYVLLKPGNSLTLSAININCSEPNGGITMPIKSGEEWIELVDEGELGYSADHDGTYSAEWTPQRPGFYKFLFPNDDLVKISVYDPTQMQAYEVYAEKNFYYREISGTAIYPRSDRVIDLETPFPIKFASEQNAFGSIAIGGSGAIGVVDPSYSIWGSNTQFPGSFTQHTSIIAPFWADLMPQHSDGGIYYDTLGTAPDREFVVEYRNVKHYNSIQDETIDCETSKDITSKGITPNGVTFQVVFFENSSDILFNYLDVDFGHSCFDKGITATVGVQSTQDKFVEFSYGEAKLEANTGLRFKLKNE